MKKSKFFWILVGLITINFALAGCMSQNTSAATYYKRVKNPTTNAPIAVNYPTNFDDFVKAGDATITGTVKKVEPLVIDSTPYTVARIKVKKVLAGTKIKKGQTIKVVFYGGNLKKSEVTKSGNKKKGQNFLEVTDDKTIAKNTVTVEYPDSYLPEVGDQFALVLTKNPAGFHGYKTFWEPLYGDKGIFKKVDGKYFRKSSAADKKDAKLVAENKLMNKAMTNLVK